MSLGDAESKIQYLETVLDEMERVRGSHEMFAHKTHTFLYNAQSAYESLDSSVGGHSGGRPDDELLDWTFEAVNEDRHNERNRVAHADVDLGRTPDRFGNVSPEDLLAGREGDHAYYFERDGPAPIPSRYAGDPVQEVCETILTRLQRKLKTVKSQTSESDEFSLISNDSWTDAV